MNGVKVIATTGRGEMAIRQYVKDCAEGVAYKAIGMSKMQYRTAKLTSKVLPYEEEYFENPMMIVVTMKKGLLDSYGYLVIPKVEITLKNLMEKYGCGLQDYNIEVF